MKALQSSVWKPATPKGVLQSGVWKTPKKVSVLDNGVWKQVWPDAAPAPLYLYDCTTDSVGNWTVNFTVLDGWPAGDPEEAYMFRCSTMPNDGYVGRTFSKTWTPNAYNGLDCTLEDISNIPGKTRQTISFKIYPRA